MDLETYLSTSETAASLAARIGVTPAFISQWRSGYRPVPIHLAVRIEQMTQGGVTRRDLRPDDWADIWPELATDQAAQQG